MEEKQAKQNYVLRLVQASLILITLSLVIIFSRYVFLPERIPLFYSQPWGEEQLALKNTVFIIPAASVVFLILNFQFGKLLSKNGADFWSLVAVGSAFLFSILGAIIVWKVVFLIT